MIPVTLGFRYFHRNNRPPWLAKPSIWFVRYTYISYCRSSYERYYVSSLQYFDRLPLSTLLFVFFLFMIFQNITKNLKNKIGHNRILFYIYMLNKMQNELPDESGVTTNNILFNIEADRFKVPHIQVWSIYPSTELPVTNNNEIKISSMTIYVILVVRRLIGSLAF